MRSLWMARSVRCLCIGLHSGSIRPRKDGAGGGLEGVSGRWGVGRKGEGEKTAGIKSSARTDEIRASGRGSEEEEKPE